MWSGARRRCVSRRRASRDRTAKRRQDDSAGVALPSQGEPARVVKKWSRTENKAEGLDNPNRNER